MIFIGYPFAFLAVSIYCDALIANNIVSNMYNNLIYRHCQIILLAITMEKVIVIANNVIVNLTVEQVAKGTRLPIEEVE